MDSQSDNTSLKETTIRQANEIWDWVKKMAGAPGFIESSDEDKMKIFQEKWPDFHTGFPIVSKYMMCMGQFSTTAFRRFLTRLEGIKVNPEKRDAEDQWVKRQADYIKFLWEAYQPGRPSMRAANEIWKQAYESLKGEFVQFKEMHDKAKKAVDENESHHKVELADELIKRVISGEQQLPPDQMAALVELLKTRIEEKKAKKTITETLERHQEVMKSIRATVPPDS
jgi:hypothetical protein